MQLRAPFKGETNQEETLYASEEKGKKEKETLVNAIQNRVRAPEEGC